MLNPDMVREATRLTRAGQLLEATALLQRMLRGDGGPAATRGGAVGVEPARLGPPTLDLKAHVVEERESGPSTQATSVSVKGRKRPAPFGGIKDLSGSSLPGPVGRAPPSKGDIAPGGTRFVTASFSNAAGSRTYKLFIPSRADGGARPLVVMLHGCTQCPDDFAAGTRMNFLADKRNCFVAYPEQPRGANQAKCWNWFRTGDQQRDGGEPSLIAGITRQIMREHSIDPERVYVAGLSAGGAAAAIMGATYPDLYAAVGVHSGLACGAASDLRSALAAMRQGNAGGLGTAGSPVPTIVFHGDRDNTVHPSNADRILGRSGEPASLSTKIFRGRVPDGHAYNCPSERRSTNLAQSMAARPVNIDQNSEFGSALCLLADTVRQRKALRRPSIYRIWRRHKLTKAVRRWYCKYCGGISSRPMATNTPKVRQMLHWHAASVADHHARFFPQLLGHRS